MICLLKWYCIQVSARCGLHCFEQKTYWSPPREVICTTKKIKFSCLVAVIYTDYMIMFNAHVTSSLFFRTKHFDINLKLEYKQLSNVNFTIIFTCQRIENHVKLLDWIFLMGFCRAKEDKNPVCKMVHIFCLADIPHGSTQTLGKYFCVESLYVCMGQGPTTNRSKAVSEVYDLQSNLQKKKSAKKRCCFLKGDFPYTEDATGEP